MNIAGPAVRNAITVTMIYLIVVGFGLFSLGRLQLDMYPDVSFPTVIILTNYTGASLVEARFAWGQNMERAETDVRRKLEMIESLLPVDAEKSMIFAFDPSLAPIILMTVTGPYPLDELRRIAERDIEPRLVRLPGVASAEVDGGLEREIRVELDPVKVAAFGLDVNQIVGAVYRENMQIPGGSVQQGALDFSIQAKGKYQRVEDIGEVVVGVKMEPTGPVPIRLKEVSKVRDTYYEAQRILEVDGSPAVFVIINKQSGANTVLASRAVTDALPTIKRSAAADIDYKIIFNQADFINASLGNLSSTGMVGVGITFLVLLFFLRHVRSALIVAASIPVSVVATFAVMDQAHMTLNVLTMAGLALSIGMLVDNSIVVLENIFRLREEGMDPWSAAIEGTRTVWNAVSGSTFTTIVVFVPVLFVPGIAGVLFKDMSITICFSLTLSLIVALTLIPLAASRMLGAKRGDKAIKRAATRGRTFQRIYAWYDRSLRWSLRHQHDQGHGHHPAARCARHRDPHRVRGPGGSVRHPDVGRDAGRQQPRGSAPGRRGSREARRADHQA
jgi:HAE1 family hydrophobic/amphiphilic exporter-1